MKINDKRGTIRLDLVENGVIFQLESITKLYIATDEYNATSRKVVDLQNGMLLNFDCSDRVIIRDDLILTNI